MFLQNRMQIDKTVLSPFGLENEMIPLLFKWFNSPQIYRFMGDIDQFPFTVDDARNYYLSHKKDTWLICDSDKETLTPIGYTGLFIRKRHSIGIFRIAIAEKEYQGKSHARKATRMLLRWAFEECDLRNIHLSVSSSNENAITLYERIGFKKCGCYQNSRYEDGQIFDEILMEFPRELFKTL